MAARKSLKDQLAELSQPAPIDLDPEDALAANDPSHDDPHRWPSAIDDPVAREHYVDVAPSALRKLHDSVNDPKYDGIRTSRKHLYDDRSDHATDDEDVADNEEQQDGRSVPSHSESGTDEDEDEELHSPADDTDSQDEDESGSGSEHEHEHSPSRQDQVNEASTSLSQIDINSGRAPASLRPVTDITSNLRKTHEADKKKGKAVSRQIALWDTLLDARIQLHKAVTAANRLPLPSEVQRYASHPAAREALDGLFSVADSLAEELFSLQEDLLRTNESIEPPARKRRKLTPLSSSPVSPPPPSAAESSISDPAAATSLSAYSDALTAHSAAASALEAAYHPWALDTLSKWSAKVQAVAPTVLLPDAKGSFLRGGAGAKDPKTLGVVALVDDILRADRAKLLDRTRKRKDRHARLGYASAADEDAAAGGDDGDERLDPELFDDTDYYQQLLRDVIAARSGAGGAHDAGEQQWQIQQRERKARRKKTVDTKASKGRKLRYDVHPKLQNFMVPVPVLVGEWHEEQIDGLFSSLLQP